MSTQDGQGGGVHRWLAPVSLAIVALAAVMGWGASFVGLHDYAQHTMSGYTTLTGWLIPATYDGAAFACTLMTYRASIHGRSAIRGRVLMWAFTAISAWINWIHQPILETKLVAAGLPVAAVAVFDVVLLELRADYETRHGRKAFRLRPGLLLLRWCVDRAGTTAAFRNQITGIPVEQLAGLALIPAAGATSASTPARSTPNGAPLPTDSTTNTSASAAVNGAGMGTPGGMSVQLPQALIDRLQRAHAESVLDGRAFTAADVQHVVNVNNTVAERIVTDLAATNNHHYPEH